MEHNIKLTDEEYVSSPVEAFKESLVRLFETNLRSFILITLLSFALILIAIAGVIGVIVVNSSFALFENGSAPTSEVLFKILGGVAIVLLICSILSVIITIASNYIFARSQNEQTTGVLEALKIGFRRFWPMIGAVIVCAVMVLLGLLLFIIPGIYLLLRLAYVGPIIANEKIGPIDAIKRSFYLTKGNLWEIIGIVSVAGVASFALNIPQFILGVTDSMILILFAIALGIVAVFIGASLNAIIFFRYHQSDLQKKQLLTRGKTSPLNYLAILLVFIAFIVAGVVTEYSENQNKTGPSTETYQFNEL